jgi:3-phenylpropionate/trans-cinnamate dioxygenase ferredoxin subunit
VTIDTHDICGTDELGEGQMRLVEIDGRKIGVFRCADGSLVAIEDRCSHDDGPLAEGEFDATACTVECPRHGSLFDLRTGRPKSLPAYRPVETFEVREEDEAVKLEV